MEGVLLGLRVVRGWVSAECDVGSCERGGVRVRVVRGWVSGE